MNHYLMSLSLIAFSTLVWANPPSQKIKEQAEPKPVSFLQNIMQGTTLGVAEVTAHHPLATIKLYLQQGQTWTDIYRSFKQNRLNFVKELYIGYGVNAGSMAPVTALQVAANSVLTSYFSDNDKKYLSDYEKIKAAFLAGGLSAFASCPAEGAMLEQQILERQKQPATLSAAIKNLHETRGLAGIYRAILPTFMRDGGFAVGYLALSDILKKHLGIPEDQIVAGAIAGGIPAGVFAAVATQPADTVKTRIQAKNIGLFEATRSIYQEDGLATFFKGLTPRGTRVASAIALMTYLSTCFKNVMQTS